MTTATDVDVEALFEELSRIEGKGEIVDGKVIEMGGTGPWPARTAMLIVFSLFQYSRQTKQGFAATDNNVFRVNLPHRQSFSPDAAYHIGGMQPMKYYEGAPAFAVEVRSENDYGRRAEREMAAKRADYFAAEHWWCGMSICSQTMSCGSTVQRHRKPPPSIAPATPPKPNPPYPDGRCP